jgi:hypothetical protein
VTFLFIPVIVPNRILPGFHLFLAKRKTKSPKTPDQSHSWAKREACGETASPVGYHLTLRYVAIPLSWRPDALFTA